MSAEIHIQPKSGVLVRGKSMRVPISLNVSEPLKVRGVHAEFRGAEETKAHYTTYNAATKTTQVHTAVQHVDHVRREFHLSGRPRRGAFGNIADALATMLGRGEHEVLQPGRHPFEVEVDVPAEAPGSF
ncbi:MAG: hypothetical protein KY475_06345, partial [Planctomycetes bacterium]|nr:hypothetical protein [Planctomycetota bacterium]